MELISHTIEFVSFIAVPFKIIAPAAADFAAEFRLQFVLVGFVIFLAADVGLHLRGDGVEIAEFKLLVNAAELRHGVADEVFVFDLAELIGGDGGALAVETAVHALKGGEDIFVQIAVVRVLEALGPIEGNPEAAGAGENDIGIADDVNELGAGEEFGQLFDATGVRRRLHYELLALFQREHLDETLHVDAPAGEIGWIAAVHVEEFVVERRLVGEGHAVIGSRWCPWRRGRIRLPADGASQ